MKQVRENVFTHFLSECDIIVNKVMCVSINDLPDAQWRSYHEDDMNPLDAVLTAMEDYWQDEINGEEAFYAVCNEMEEAWKSHLAGSRANG
jgi:hypothetical protein